LILQVVLNFSSTCSLPNAYVGSNEEEPGRYLDEICILKPDHGLHSNAGVTDKIFGLASS
jgi:hypothetical protein